MAVESHSSWWTDYYHQFPEIPIEKNGWQRKRQRHLNSSQIDGLIQFNLVNQSCKERKAGLAWWPLRISCLERRQHLPHRIALCISKSCLHFLVPAESSTFVIWQQSLVLSYSQNSWINLWFAPMLQVSKSQKSDSDGRTRQGLGKDISAQSSQECSQFLKWNGISFVNQWPHWVTISPKGWQPASHTMISDSLLCEHVIPGVLSLLWIGPVLWSI